MATHLWVVLSKYEVMKRVIWCIVMIVLVSNMTIAQSAKKKSSIKTSERNVKAGTGTNKTASNAARHPKTYTLTSTSANNAFNLQQTTNRFEIADPTIRALNARANGADIKISPSGIVGVPKGTYGFANGRLSLYPNGSTSIGTTTGSGSVGTGSGPGSIGTSGPAIGVNGKSPFTGTGPYGTRVPLIVEAANDSGRTTGIKRN